MKRLSLDAAEMNYILRLFNAADTPLRIGMDAQGSTYSVEEWEHRVSQAGGVLASRGVMDDYGDLHSDFLEILSPVIRPAQAHVVSELHGQLRSFSVFLADKSRRVSALISRPEGVEVVGFEGYSSIDAMGAILIGNAAPIQGVSVPASEFSGVSANDEMALSIIFSHWLRPGTDISPYVGLFAGATGRTEIAELAAPDFSTRMSNTPAVVVVHSRAGDVIMSKQRSDQNVDWLILASATREGLARMLRPR